MFKSPYIKNTLLGGLFTVFIISCSRSNKKITQDKHTMLGIKRYSANDGKDPNFINDTIRNQKIIAERFIPDYSLTRKERNFCPSESERNYFGCWNSKQKQA